MTDTVEPAREGVPVQGVTRREDEVDRRAAYRAVGVSALGLGLTGLAELLLALLTNSVALLADALHNLSDVSTSVMVFMGFRISKRAPTERYPYGYERAEDLAGIGVVIVIWLSAALAGYESYRKLVSHGSTSHLAMGIVGASIGVLGNQLVARYKLRVGRKINSATLIADARHSWLDAISSVGAMVGLVLVAFGFRWGDPVAGFAVTLFIVHVGYEVTTEISHHLMDGVDPSMMQAARLAALGVSPVQSANVRGRWMGRSLLVEIEGVVSPDTTVAGADAIGLTVEQAIFDAVPVVQRV
ncbi:MAG: cation diffusion facilitator family transporter [Actinomycetota bacterium]|nr:cation diffusion facilitator family transporter [Actinomycetota bacterium]